MDKPVTNTGNYDTLMRFPLFQGLGKDEATQVLAHTRLNFTKHHQGEVVIGQGQNCQQLTMLASGQLIATSTPANEPRVRLVETMTAPAMLQTERLFGLKPQHTATFTALGDVSLITISKRDILRLAGTFAVIRINLISALATAAQRRNDTWAQPPRDLAERIMRTVADKCITPTGTKTLHITMQRLADELGASRLDTSRALHQLEAHHQATLSRERIVFYL